MHPGDFIVHPGGPIMHPGGQADFKVHPGGSAPGGSPTPISTTGRRLQYEKRRKKCMLAAFMMRVAKNPRLGQETFCDLRGV